jgi:DivIVA domain-containing protein
MSAEERRTVSGSGVTPAVCPVRRGSIPAVVTVLALLGVVAVLFLAAVVATRGGGELAPAPPDTADVGLPDGPLRAQDVAALRFPVAVRGYRMAEVDAALERLAEELAVRDRLLADLAEQDGGAPVHRTGDPDRVDDRRRPADVPDGPAGASRRAAGDWPT